jgi:mannose-6-phosphate isomerase-like protein (cupin superfamily)
MNLARYVDENVFKTKPEAERSVSCIAQQPPHSIYVKSEQSQRNGKSWRSFMTDTKSYPYVTHLDIKYPSLDLIDVEALAKSVTDQWYNQTLCRVNDSVVRLGVMQGEYHWHKHDNDDEFFFVLSGRFIVDLEERSVDLLPGQGFVVPKGVMHCTRAPERSVILMVETAAIVPTGDA